MENEIRFYLNQILACMAKRDDEDDDVALFEPSYLIQATRLPTGAIEIAINDRNIKEKIEYILDAYDEHMCHKHDSNVRIENIMVV